MSDNENDLIARLTESGLVTPLQVAECWVQLGETQDEARLLGSLASRGILTRWQVKQILAGKARGFIMGHYKVLEPLGVGGMGQVFRALDTQTDRHVAVKVLPRRFATPRGIERFRREGQAALALQHNHIVRCFELGQEDETLFLVMELVDGTDLAVRLAKNRILSVAETARIGYEVALALEYAHERGFIHRDIKPSNIMLTQAGQVKVGDLGLAKFFGSGDDRPATLTYSGALLGTVDYMAPEQAEDARQADARSDIYSLGCTLFHCLTGQPPFPQGTTVQKIIAHHTRLPPSIHEFNSDAPAELCELIMDRMLAKQPDQRFQTPGAVAEALEPWVEREQEPAESPLQELYLESLAAEPRAPEAPAPELPAPEPEEHLPKTLEPVSRAVFDKAAKSDAKPPAIDWESLRAEHSPGKQTTYKIRIFTGDFPEAGTDGEVMVSFAGTEGESGYQRYEPDQGSFKRGYVQEFLKSFADLGGPYECTVCFRPRGSDAEWFLWKIDLITMHPYEKW
ncbi:MAG: protein kinase, partial [Planctomycetes bacterium]|nr:protein kinase [Planctomycetota bacterium]